MKEHYYFYQSHLGFLVKANSDLYFSEMTGLNGVYFMEKDRRESEHGRFCSVQDIVDLLNSNLKVGIETENGYYTNFKATHY